MPPVPWTSLSKRIDKLPWVLAGPIVRCVTSTSASIWLATHVDVTISMEVTWANGGSWGVRDVKLHRMGEKLYIGLVTATGDSASGEGTYYIKLKFEGTSRTLREDCGINPYSGSEYRLCTPPDQLDKVRIMHGSCRRPNGEGYDALAFPNQIMLEQPEDEWPHLLLLTGDQVYGDSSGIPFLFLVRDAAETLLGWRESLPGPVAKDTTLAPEAATPGMRTAAAKAAGFTNSYPPHSHFFGFAEYLITYLFVWSDVLWPPGFPDSETMIREELRRAFPNEDDTKRGARFDDWVTGQKLWKYQKSFEDDIDALARFRHTLRRVRMVLANVPTYMMWDDHDVTDDWFLSSWWTEKVLASELGRATLRGGMTAFMLCQALGNNPHDFIGDAAVPANKSALNFALALVDRFVADGMVDQTAAAALEVYLGLARGTKCMVKFHFRLLYPGFELLVLDTRTCRYLPSTHEDSKPLEGYPLLIDPDRIREQIPDVAAGQARSVTIVVSPPPVFGLPGLEGLQELLSDPETAKIWSPVEQLLVRDAESWAGQEVARQTLLARLASRQKQAKVVFLSGDVHFAYSNRIEMAAESKHFRAATSGGAVFVQLTSSALHNHTELRFKPDNESKLLGSEPLGHLWDTVTGSTELLHYLGFGSAPSQLYTVGCANTRTPASKPWFEATVEDPELEPEIVLYKKPTTSNPKVQLGGAAASELAEWVISDPGRSPALVSATSIVTWFRQFAYVQVPKGFPVEWGYHVALVPGIHHVPDSKGQWVWDVALTTAQVLTETAMRAKSQWEDLLKKITGVPNEEMFSRVPGQEVIGYNNIGLVRFTGSGTGDPRVVHEVFWGADSIGQAKWMTRWSLSLAPSNQPLSSYKDMIK